MKKIFRMALVFALAGATLMYTGCSKDYSEDINRLDDSISALKNDLSQQVNTLSGTLSTLQGTVSDLDRAYKLADQGLQGGIDKNAQDIEDLKKKVSDAQDDIDQINKALENYAKKSELDDVKKALEEKIENAVAKAAQDLADLRTEILAKAEALQSQIDATNGKIDDLEKKLDAAKTELEGKLAAAKEALQEEIDNLQTVIEDLQGQIEEANANIADLQALQEAQEALNDVFDALGTELRSIVFVPELYYAGIEATEYSYAVLFPYAITPLDAEKTFNHKVDNDPVKYGFPVGAKAVITKSGRNVVYPWQAEDIEAYSIGESATAQYNLNPSVFDVEKADWALNGYDKKYVVKGDEDLPATWMPVFDGIVNNGGIADVTYHIVNPMLLNGLVESTYKSIMAYLFNEDGRFNEDPLNLYGKIAEVLDNANGVEAGDEIIDIIVRELGKINGTVSVMNLEASIKAEKPEDAKIIASDYEAIVSDYEMLEWLAFASDNSFVTSTEKIVPCAVYGAEDNSKHLYHFADTAVVNAPSVPIFYNCGSKDLKPLINIHVVDSEGGYEATLAELQKKYGKDITMKFELVPYTIGKHVTQESAYGFIEDGVFFPAYVKDEKDLEAGQPYTSVKCGTDGKGISAVGRLPLVLVTLWDGDNMLLHGYFVIEITEEEINPDPQVIDLKDFGTFPYLCTIQKGETYWYEYSDNVLEALGMTYAKMISKYQLMTGKDNEEGTLETIVPGNTYTRVKMFVKDENGQMVPAKGLGHIEYWADKEGNGINDKFVWAFNKGQADKFENPQEVYVLLQAGAYEKVYFKFSASIAEKPHLTIGKKRNSDWNADVLGETNNTVTINAYVPNADESTPVLGGDVKQFYKTIDDTFYSDDPKVAAPVVSFDMKNSDPAYADAEIEGFHTYVFNAVQPDFEGYQLFPSADGLQLWAEKISDGKAYADYKTTDADAEMIAEIVANPDYNAEEDEYDADFKNTVKYNNDSEIAKLLLNMKGWQDPEMLYANVDIQLAYGDGDTCKIPTDIVSFHTRFIRPLTIALGSQDMSKESMIDGDNVPVIDFLSSIVDWQKFDVIKVTKSGDKKTYAPNVIKTIDLYAYYGFTKVTIDFAATQTNNFNTEAEDPMAEFGDLSQYRKEAKLQLGTIDAKEVFTADDGTLATEVEPGVFEIDATTLDVLKQLVINYRNGRVVSEQFDLLIPVTFTYSWGDYEGVFVIHVDPTGVNGSNPGV